jgi:glycerol-3-phosphate dehydrogenase
MQQSDSLNTSNSIENRTGALFCDVLVIGGGVLGCFVARNLARYKLNVAVLEKNADIASEITKANSAIIYAGYDTKPGTLKSKLCVAANRDMERLCAELSVPYHRTGSLMAAFGPDSSRTLERKIAQGLASGLTAADIKLISGDEARALEPRLSKEATAALYCTGTGTLQPWTLAIAAAENAAANGVEFFLNTKVVGINHNESTGLRRFARNDDGSTGLLRYARNDNRSTGLRHYDGSSYTVITGGGGTFYARAVVNAAGIYSDQISALMTVTPRFVIKPNLADFLVTDTYADGFINHILFFETEEHGKDIQVVPTVDGNILVSPEGSERGTSDDSVTNRESREGSKQGLLRMAAAVSRFLPGFPVDQTIRTFAGLRPNPYDVGADRSINDLVISEDAPGFVSLIGVKTPGLTCANEIGSYVAELITDRLGITERNTEYDGARQMKDDVCGGARRGITQFSELGTEMQESLISKDSAWGEIVCRCRHITEREIRNALRRTPAAATTDAVKHRTGACMGRCQGGYCRERIADIISDELKREI